MSTSTNAHNAAASNKRSDSTFELLANGAKNKLLPEDRPAHDWYRFVLSFPPHLVSEYIRRFDLSNKNTILDPFCGTGTTLVEAKLLEIPSTGIEANPLAHFASQVKLNWDISPDDLLSHADHIADNALQKLHEDGIEDAPFFHTNSATGTSLRRLPVDTEKLLLKDSISQLPLHKVLVLIEALEQSHDERFHAHLRLALAKSLVFSISNLRFGPEVGIGKPKADVPVIGAWMKEVRQMSEDLRYLKSRRGAWSFVHLADSRKLKTLLKAKSIDAVITSPPYPNEKDYTRTTRLESVLLGFINNKDELRALKRNLVRSNTRSVYKSDDDDHWITGHKQIQQIADRIEQRRIELGKTSGFERAYPRVTKLYFGGMYRHLADLRHVLKPGAQLAYVVGDQASFLRVLIRTGELIADIAESLGYEVENIDLYRTRLATATKERLREEVVCLRWPGSYGRE